MCHYLALCHFMACYYSENLIFLLILSTDFSPQFLPVPSRTKRGLLEQLQTAAPSTSEHLSEQPAVSHGLAGAATKSLKLKCTLF